MNRTLSAAALFGALLTLGATGVRAASGGIVAGPMFFLSGETFTCQVVNVTERPIDDVVVRIRNQLGVVLAGGSCETLDPFESCGFTVNDADEEIRASCEADSARGARGLRATLQNHDTGATSDAR